MDILHDNYHATLLNIKNSYGMPDYVLSATALDKEASAKLSDKLYADTARRAYPIDSPANTWLSAAFFAKTAEDDGYRPEIASVVEANIKRAADVYGIRDDVDSIMSRIRTVPVEKHAEDDESNYGYPDGKLYPMFDAEGVKMANDHFEENAFNFPPAMRHQIARAILKKSASHHVQVNDRVRKEAQVGLPRRDFMAVQVIDRANRSPDVKIAHQLLCLNEQICTAGIDEIGANLMKMAELIEGLDHLTGLDQQYGKIVLAPSDFLFDVSIKEANDFASDTVQLGNTYFSVEKLAELPISVYTNALGAEFGDRIKSASGEIDVEKLSDELFSMPTPDKNALFDSIRASTAQ